MTNPNMIRQVTGKKNFEDNHCDGTVGGLLQKVPKLILQLQEVTVGIQQFCSTILLIGGISSRKCSSCLQFMLNSW